VSYLSTWTTYFFLLFEYSVFLLRLSEIWREGYRFVHLSSRKITRVLFSEKNFNSKRYVKEMHQRNFLFHTQCNEQINVCSVHENLSGRKNFLSMEKILFAAILLKSWLDSWIMIYNHASFHTVKVCDFIFSRDS